MHRIPVILYDQIGGGASSHRPDAPTEFWVPELFMDELDNLTKALGIDADFDLFGQSWGGASNLIRSPRILLNFHQGMLAAQYAASRTPKGLKRLIIANSPASTALNTKGTDALLSKFPEDFIAIIRKHEAEGTMECDEYQDGAMQFSKKHTCTVDPWPQDLLDAFDILKKDMTVCKAM